MFSHMAEALRLVDQRMYAPKRSGHRSGDRQSHDVLLHVLRERSPDMSAQGREIGALAALSAVRRPWQERSLRVDGLGAGHRAVD